MGARAELQLHWRHVSSDPPPLALCRPSRWLGPLSLRAASTIRGQGADPATGRGHCADPPGVPPHLPGRGRDAPPADPLFAEERGSLLRGGPAGGRARGPLSVHAGGGGRGLVLRGGRPFGARSARRRRLSAPRRRTAALLVRRGGLLPRSSRTDSRTAIPPSIPGAVSRSGPRAPHLSVGGGPARGAAVRGGVLRRRPPGDRAAARPRAAPGRGRPVPESGLRLAVQPPLRHRRLRSRRSTPGRGRGPGEAAGSALRPGHAIPARPGSQPRGGDPRLVPGCAEGSQGARGGLLHLPGAPGSLPLLAGGEEPAQARLPQSRAVRPDDHRARRGGAALAAAAVLGGRLAGGRRQHAGAVGPGADGGTGGARPPQRGEADPAGRHAPRGTLLRREPHAARRSNGTRS